MQACDCLVRSHACLGPRQSRSETVTIFDCLGPRQSRSETVTVPGTQQTVSDVQGCKATLPGPRPGLQGYLAHKKLPPRRTTAGLSRALGWSYGGGVSHERGTPAARLGPSCRDCPESEDSAHVHTLESLAWHWSHWSGRFVNVCRVFRPRGCKATLPGHIIFHLLRRGAVLPCRMSPRRAHAHGTISRKWRGGQI